MSYQNEKAKQKKVFPSKLMQNMKSNTHDLINAIVSVYGRFEGIGSIQKTKIFTKLETREKYLSNAPSHLRIALLEAENEPETKLELFSLFCENLELKWNPVLIFLTQSFTFSLCVTQRNHEGEAGYGPYTTISTIKGSKV